MKILHLIILIFPAYTFATELDEKWELWESKNIPSYQYTLIKGAGPFGYTIYKVKINSGICKAKEKYIFNRKPIFWKQTTCDGIKFNDLYDSIKKQIRQGVKRIEIKYDEKYGFVKYLSVEPDTKEEDTDWHFNITKFETK